MKKLVSLLSLGLLLATASAYAQNIKVKANVPFSFAVAKAELPSGEYTIQSVDLANRALMISAAGQKSFMVLANSCSQMKPAASTKLVFHRYGDSYFLSEVWMQGHNAGHQLLKSTREVEMAKSQRAQEVIVLAELR